MNSFKNILLINYGGIGDEILFLPVISSIKKQFKEAKITLALEPRSKCIKDLCSDINEIICVDIKASGFKKYFNILKFIFACHFKNFDLVISSGKSPLVALILFLTGIKKRIGYKSKLDFLLTKSVKLNENQYAAKMYHNLVEDIVEAEYETPYIKLDENYRPIQELNGQYVCIHPGVSKMSISKNIYKCPKLPFWNGLIEGLLNKNKKVVLLGSCDDKELIEQILENKNIAQNSNFINFYDKTKNIKEMAHIMKNSSCLICVDSAPLHVGVCTNTKIYAVFAPTNELKLVPQRENIKVIKNNLSCRPCLWDKRTSNCKTSQCLDIDYNLILNEIN